ncbi:MAG: hypothetical protein C4520_02620 [Candidatus Abyssobacteria bacterium SURF_5]|uniref:Uncharacterized protein n=1 Tax=Abyssobacteria bacterium (strain SURF_5) TaxID=2093360 RepID=A0A3A4NY07_ABYX5|nr:MAG: hypothetical protein C4520_02620 [Candidatus Abyssubacteria bacterium SURF_5]
MTIFRIKRYEEETDKSSRFLLSLKCRSLILLQNPHSRVQPRYGRCEFIRTFKTGRMNSALPKGGCSGIGLSSARICGICGCERFALRKRADAPSQTLDYVLAILLCCDVATLSYQEQVQM